MKNDLRVQRTKRNIRDAFVELRKIKEINEITVVEIAKRAMINKATFYLHYRDIFDLEEKLEDEHLEKEFSQFNADEILKNPRKVWSTMFDNSFKKENVDFVSSNILKLITKAYVKTLDVIYSKYTNIDIPLYKKMQVIMIYSIAFFQPALLKDYSVDQIKENIELIINSFK